MPAQRGFAMIAILALVALITAFLIASALNRTPADVSNEREDRSMSALRKAKAALIAYAANEQWQYYKNPPPPPLSNTGYFQPGALPSPDLDDSGNADFVSGSNAWSQIGRVPYKTIGLDDLRDASGERLWYALSHDFRKLRCPQPPAAPVIGCTTINSDTQGQLTVVGLAPALQVVAVLFAPGEALQGQNRDPANATAHNDPLNYLEGPPNLDLPAKVNFVFTTASPSATFNDRVLTITRAELMDAVEPVVAANIERDVKPLLLDYFGKWNRYPFAMSFVSPPVLQSAYVGSFPQTRGLLPVTKSATVSWGGATVTQIASQVGEKVDSASCSISSLTVTCGVHWTDGKDDHNARPTIRIDVFPVGFVDLPSPITQPYNIFMKNGDGDPAQFSGPPWGYWSPTGPPPTSTVAGGVLSYTGWLHDAHDMKNQATIIFSVPALVYLPGLTNASTTPPNIDWFISNQWYRQTYYAVAPEWASGGAGNCTANPCLTVNNLPGPNNKQAILIFAGRAMDGQIHPSANPKDYLEGANCDLDIPPSISPASCNLPTTDYVYEHRSGPSPTINDRVVVVAP